MFGFSYLALTLVSNFARWADAVDTRTTLDRARTAISSVVIRFKLFSYLGLLHLLQRRGGPDSQALSAEREPRQVALTAPVATSVSTIVPRITR